MARLDHNDFYVYQHKESDTGRVFYVGRGRNKRWKEAGSKRSQYWHRIVAKHGFIPEKIYEGLTCKRANELEAMLIAAYGRENLCNLTDGGDGMSGGTHTKEWCEMMSKRFTGRIMNEEWRKKIAEGRTVDKHWNWGKKLPEAIIKNMHGHGTDTTVCMFRSKDDENFIGTVNQWMHKFSMSKSDAINMSVHRNTGRYNHVKGWSIDRSWRG